MKIIKDSKRAQCKNEEGILCSEVNDRTVIQSSKFYGKAPFPGYQAHEDGYALKKILSGNVFLSDLKSHIVFGKKFIEVGSGTCQVSLAFAKTKMRFF